MSFHNDWNALREEGRVRREKRAEREAQRRSRVLALHEEGLESRVMAERLHVGIGQVRRLLKELNLKGHGKGGGAL